jgi:drug/metabolite transporter (DMT)-like permease
MVSAEVWTGALRGVGISLACAAVWAIAAAVGRSRGAKRFVAAHLGGMATRLALALGLSAWAMSRMDMHTGAFLLALLGSYTLLMITEVLWLARERRRLSVATRLAVEARSR